MEIENGIFKCVSGYRDRALVAGSSRVPRVRDMLQEYFNDKK